MKDLFRKWKTVSGFSFLEWKMIWEVYLLLCVVRLRLFCSSPRLVDNALSVSPRRQSTPHPKIQLLRLFDVAWRYQWGRPTCLSRALAQQAFFSHYGVPIRFRIGVRKKQGRLEAHAWCDEPDRSAAELSSEDCFHVLKRRQQ